MTLTSEDDKLFLDLSGQSSDLEVSLKLRTDQTKLETICRPPTHISECHYLLLQSTYLTTPPANSLGNHSLSEARIKEDGWA